MVEISFSIKGESEQVSPMIEKFMKILQESKAGSSVLVDRNANRKPGPIFEEGSDGYYAQMVWSKITAKAKHALYYMAHHPDGCSKEEIVKGMNGFSHLSDTRDLGGALSSISRRCKALLFNLNVVYEKIETPHGPRYVMTDAVADAIKQLGEHIDDNDPRDVVAGNGDED